MIGLDNSVLGGCIGAATILTLNYALTRLLFASKKAERWPDGAPTVLIHNGRVRE